MSHRRSPFFQPREYADQLADEMGEGSEAAGGYARGSSRLRRLLHLAREGREKRQETPKESEVA